MATSYTTLLGLALPATGELSGTWGDTVNNYISTYVDSAVAGALAISLTGDVTLTKTTGSSLGSTSSQYAVLNVTPSASTWTITVPAASKVYVINNLSGSFTFTFKASGQTGITIATSEKCIVAFNGTDFARVASTSAFASPPGGSNTYVQYNNSGAFGGSANLTFSGSQLLTTGTNKVIAAATQDAVVVQGRAGGTGSFSATITPTTLSANRTFTLPDADGTALISGGALGTPSSGTLTNCTFPTLNQNTTGTAATATNLAGGSAGTVPYQTGSGATAFTAVGTSTQVLTSNGSSAPSWTTISTGPPTTYGAVGTYVTAMYPIGYGTGYDPGTLSVSGSDLLKSYATPAVIAFNIRCPNPGTGYLPLVAADYSGNRVSLSLSGTWINMTALYAGGFSGTDYMLALWLRIS